MEDKYKGWIEDFGSVVNDQLGEETKQKVLDQCKSCQKISNDKEMAQCIQEVMIKFDKVVSDKEKRYNIMETLGNTCFNRFFVKIAGDIKKKSNEIDEIIQNINKASGAEYFKLEDNKIYATFNQCLCQIGVREAEEPISKTYCSCSLGWMKSLFNMILDNPFKVELIDSIVSGGKSCQFIIDLF
ncbi:MAG: DUF6144 family protein [Candidatus Hodarchaeota archaeon]